MEPTPPESVDQVLLEGFAPPIQRRSIYKRDASISHTPSDELGNVIAYLGNLQAQLKENERQATSAAAAPEPGRKLLQEKRLSRSGVPLDPIFTRFGAPGEAGFTAAELEPGILPESGWMDVPADLAGFVTVPLTPTTVWNRPYALPAASDDPPAPSPTPSRWLRPLAATVAVLALTLAAGLIWRASFPRTALANPRAAVRVAVAGSDDYPPDETVSDDALAAADQTLDAMARGDLSGASALLDDAHRRNLGLPGLSYQAALLALNRGDEDRFAFWTDRSLAAHEFVSECWYLRALAANTHGDFQGAVDGLEAAAHFDPFNPRYPYFWAEFLRRTGKPALALPHFQQALRCRPVPADADLIVFKQRLARIEAGHDPAFQADLAEHLAREPVSGDTFLLGAASKIRDSDFPAAVADLRRAAQVLPTMVLRARLRDYFFMSQAAQPDLAAFLASLPPLPAANRFSGKPGKILVDPATRGLADADPAGW